MSPVTLLKATVTLMDPVVIRAMTCVTLESAAKVVALGISDVHSVAHDVGALPS